MTDDADTLFGAMPFAANLPGPVQAHLKGRVRTLSAGSGEILLRPGDMVSGIYFVAAGAVRVHYLDPNGHEGTLYRLEPGESCILAINCLFAEMSYPAWAEVEDDGAMLLVLDGSAARELAHDNDRFLKALFDQLSSRLYQLLGTLERAIRLPLDARLARLLLDLAGDGDEVRLSHESLASHLGTSREVVSRIMRGLARNGLIESGYGRIRLAEKQELQRRSQ